MFVLVSAENDNTERGGFCPGIVDAVKDDTDAEMIENRVAVFNTELVLCSNPLDDTNAVDVDNLEM